MTMKLAAFAAAVIIFTAPAYAADVISYEPAPVVEAAPVSYDWSGFYVGVTGGYAWTSLDMPLGFGTEKFDGGALGGLVGFNLQNENFVYGLEADIAKIWAENDYLVYGLPMTASLDIQGTVRARVGYAFDRTLLYATGGLAIAHGDVKMPFGGDSVTLVGWTIGAGVEQAMTDNITTRIEYRYAKYGKEDFDLGMGDFEADEHTVRVGLTYKF